MNFLNLKIDNFCSHSNSEICFDNFSSALIVGKKKGNEKFSNGAGKSTIFSAIKYVIFNEVDFSTLDKAIRHGTDTCKVSLDFHSPVDNEIYRIIRSKNKKIGSEVRLFKRNNNSWDDLTQRRNTDTEKEISKIIKINYKTFCNSVFFAQSDMSGFASLTPEKRKQALKDVLQLNIYSKYETLAKDKSKDILKEIELEKAIQRTLGNPDIDISKFESNLNNINLDLISCDEKILNNKTSLDEENNKYIYLSKMLNDFEQNTNEFISKSKLLENNIKKTSDVIKEYEKKKNTIKNNIILINDEIRDLQSKIDKNLSLNIRDKSMVKNDIDKYSQLLIDQKSLYNSELSKYDELNIPLPEGSSCKYCRQIIQNREKCQDEVDKAIEDKKIIIKEIKNNINNLNTIYNKLNSEYKNIDTIEGIVSNTRSNLFSKKTELENKKSLYSEFSSILQENNKNLESYNNEFISIKAKNISEINEDKFSKIKYDILQSKNIIANLQISLDSISKNKSLLSNNKAVCLHKIKERKNDKEKLKLSIDKVIKLEDRYILHQKVIQAFGSDGIPALITHTILDDFQLEANNWLAKLRPGLQLQIFVLKDRDDGDKEDTLNILYYLNKYEVEYAQLSGAEKLLAALALKLGLSSIIKKRLGIELGILLIDEADQSLDEGGLEAFENAIKYLQKEFKILIITHNNDLKMKFNNIIVVEQDENFVSTAKLLQMW